MRDESVELSSVSRSMSNRFFVDLQQNSVVGLRSVERFEIAPSTMPQGDKFTRMAQGPFHFAGQVSFVTRQKVQTVVPLADNFFETPEIRSDHRRSARERFDKSQWEAFVAEARNDQKRGTLEGCKNLAPTSPPDESNV